MEGSLSGQALRLIREWAGQHVNELSENWQLAEKHLPLKTDSTTELIFYAEYFICFPRRLRSLFFPYHGTAPHQLEVP
jgi:hypothetical protein